MFLFLIKASNIPRGEITRVFVKNYGCSANQADTEVLAGCLATAGYNMTCSSSAADIIIYNTCAVKGPTENRVIEALKRVPRGKKLIVAGCLPLINYERLSREVRFDAAIGPAAGAEITEVVRRVAEGEKIVGLDDAASAKPELSLPRVKLNPVVSVLPVNYGCLGACAYCCVVFARGRLRSYTVNEIVDRVRRDLAAGAKEFWVTSQDTACYGRDVGTNLAMLLKVLSSVEGDFRVRVGMMTPNLAQDILADLIDAFKNKKVFKFVHLPVQSGDDQVLKRMHRFYKAHDFREVVESFRATYPQITLATDVICGFPSETREAFENTLKLIREVKPDVVNISKFFARPGTAASEMRDAFVEPSEIKRRSTRASKLVRKTSLERNQNWVGWSGSVLVDEKGKVPGSWIGRNFAYKPITVKSPVNLLGEKLQVNIVSAHSTHLEGTVE